MSRHKSTISEGLRTEISNELGVYDKVKNKGWGEVSSKDCGSIVKKALEISERKENTDKIM
jgi:small acid-soluble spore protein F (minor alpha/beta-type SASP)